MDGYAVRTTDLSTDVVELQVLETISAGEVPARSLGAGQTIQIMTGAPLPQAADAVIPVERSQREPGTDRVTLQTSGITAGKNLIRAGTILRAGETILQEGTRLRPEEIALLAEMGRADVEVTSRPNVSILATGDELVPPGQPLEPGQIRNSNAPMLTAQVEQTGGEALNQGIGRDRLEELHEKVSAGLESDFLLLSGGVSAGEKDLVPQVLTECGVTQVFHKVRVKPGKPLWFGVLEKPDEPMTYVFGLPGNPVSSMLCFELFVRPAIRQFLGVSPALPTMVTVPLGKAHVARGDRPTYYPARVGWRDGGPVVDPVDWKGSSDLLAPTRANAWALFPAGDREYSAGENIEVLAEQFQT
jgi:molybdopterin molybdotransferase